MHVNFAQPLWLWGLMLIPLGMAWGLYWRLKGNANLNGINQFIDKNLIPHLLLNKMEKSNRTYTGWLYAALVFFICIALANPRWSYRDFEAYQSSASMVVLLDLSQTMNATDVSPSRIVRSRQYIEDLLNLSRGLKIGLIGFAGHPHLITPISDDIHTIKTYIPALDTDLTSVQGNSLHAALRMAAGLLEHEPGEKKSILLVSDGNIATDDFSREMHALSAQNIQVHVVGVGTKAGAPYKTKSGSLHKVQGKVVSSSLNEQVLKDIAKQGHGIYTEIGLTDLGLRAILKKAQQDQEDHVIAGKVRQWDDQYYWFLLPAAAIMLYLFRNRVLYLALVVVLAQGMIANDAYAFAIKDLFLNSEQRGENSYTDGDFAAAAQNFHDPYRKGVALYRAGDYAAAEQQFKQDQRPDMKISALYNAGNSQMQQKKWRAAVKSYEDVLKVEPDNFAAQHNLEIAKKMLAQNDDQDEDQEDKSDCECNNKDKSGKSNKDQQQNDKQQNSDQDQDKQDQDKQDQDKQNQDKQDQESDKQDSQDLDDAQDNDQQSAQKKNAQEQQVAKAQQNKDKAASKQEQARLAEDEARVEQWLNRIDSDIKIFLKNKFYVEDVLGAQ